jgi:mannose-6-phosphate isomerase-like protein (cupin superfamily)
MEPITRGIVVRNGQDRDERHRIVLGAAGMDCKVSGRDSAGGLFVMENHQTKMGGPPRHLHFDQEEFFYVLEGRYVFEVGNERFEVGPGDSLFGPRRVPHAFMFTGQGQGRLLIAYHPAGKMEAFFTELARHPGIPEAGVLKRLFSDHGMEVTGPPLTV